MSKGKLDKKKKRVVAISVFIALLIALIVLIVACNKDMPKRNNNEENRINELQGETKSLEGQEESVTDKDSNIASEEADKAQNFDSNEENTLNETDSEVISNENYDSESHTSKPAKPSVPVSPKPETPKPAEPEKPETPKPPEEKNPETPKPAEPSEPEKPAAHTHSYGAWQTVKEPTCTEEGQEERVCTVCGSGKEKRTIEAKGHIWISKTRYEEVWETHQVCSHCDYDYGKNPTDEELSNHANYDENGNQRTITEWGLHSNYKDKRVPVKKEVEYKECSVCHREAQNR